MEATSRRQLTDAEKSRIEKNRNKAKLLRESKVAILKEDEEGTGRMIKVDGSKFVDTMGGFLLDERELDIDEGERANKIAKLTEEEIAEIPLSYQTCIECSEEFADSYMYKNFDFSCCDKCKDLDEKHELVTKTDAQNEFLLKDCDFDKRVPPLKYISRKNPHKSTWASMKLYLKFQVKARALEVYGSEEKIEEERQLREEKREKSKVKKYNKQLSQLRKNVRATLYDKTYKPHVHEYGESTFNEETDEYSHACISCGFVETYEEL